MTVTVTPEQLLDAYLPAFCASCGEHLPEPGLPCSCGAVPALTRQEAADRLAQPGAMAALEAARLRAEVRQEQESISAKLVQADMIEHIDQLERERDQAAAKLPPVRTEIARLGKDARKAQAREDEAAARVEDSRRNFVAAANAEEGARRCGAPAAERTAALVQMNAAASVLQGDQGALQGAAVVRAQAEEDLRLARGRLADLDTRLRAAQHAVDNPGRPPRSVFTLTLDLTRQVLSGDLDQAEQAAVRSIAEGLASFSGATQDIADRAVQAAERERRERFRKSPAYLRPRGDGQIDVIANPAQSAVPL